MSIKISGTTVIDDSRNINAGIATATTFVGALTGTATSTTNIPNLTGDITSVNKATTLATVNSNVGTFGSGTSIPTITVNAKGLITGVTTTAVTSGTTITDDTSTNASRFLTFTSATSGSISAANVSSTKLIFNPSTGTLTATEFKVTAPGAPGTTYQGGRVICKSGCIAYIVAPSSAEVGRTWYNREDGVICGGCCTCVTGWFIPTCGQLQNPGYCCRTQWDSFSAHNYWSSTEVNAHRACSVFFNTGSANGLTKANTYCVRAFRCVTY